MTLQQATQAIRNLNKTAPSYRNELVTILQKYGNDQQFEGYQQGLKDSKKAIDNITPERL